MSYDYTLATAEPATASRLLKKIAQLRDVPFREERGPHSETHHEAYMSWWRVDSDYGVAANRDMWGVDAAAYIYLTLRESVAREEKQPEPFTEALSAIVKLLNETTGDFYFGSEAYVYLVRRKGTLFLNVHPDGWGPIHPFPELSAHERISLAVGNPEPWRAL